MRIEQLSSQNEWTLELLKYNIASARSEFFFCILQTIFTLKDTQFGPKVHATFYAHSKRQRYFENELELDFHIRLNFKIQIRKETLVGWLVHCRLRKYL